MQTRAITADAAGNFCIWDIGNGQSKVYTAIHSLIAVPCRFCHWNNLLDTSIFTTTAAVSDSAISNIIATADTLTPYTIVYKTIL
jgi:hypothetical protein